MESRSRANGVRWLFAAWQQWPTRGVPATLELRVTGPGITNIIQKKAKNDMGMGQN